MAQEFDRVMKTNEIRSLALFTLSQSNIPEICSLLRFFETGFSAFEGSRAEIERKIACNDTTMQTDMMKLMFSYDP